MKALQNEDGSALIYVLLIFAVLAITLPIIFSYTTTMSANDTRNEYEKLAYNLAVSGMQTYIQSPDTFQTNYGYLPITLPNGESIDYYQYAVPSSLAAEYTNRYLTYSDMTSSDDYVVVVEAITGDHNQNRQKDSGERFFNKKVMTKAVTPSPITEKTDTPVLSLQTATTTSPNYITGTAEPSSTVTITDKRDGNIYSVQATVDGNFSLTLYRPLYEGDVFSATAKSSGKLVSNATSTTVLAASAPIDDGYVLIEEPDGTQTVVLIQPTITTADKIIVKSEVGTYTAPNGEYIEFTAENGITIEEGVSLTSSGNGSQNQGLILTANGGDILISGTRLEDSSNSIFSDVTITAKDGNVYMENTTLIAESNVSVTASKNIYADYSESYSQKKNSGLITFTLEPNVGIIYVDNMFVNKNASTIPSNAKRCGTLLSSSSLLNGSRGPFTSCN
ncbi:Ig-like domain-containing protein [Bacillus salitolerans]|uniref:Ig-like domain-containing protein n=1 Tax=Bacillus salitolerans TaxID=1437434 RepID=A0ABW4LLN2_9BACI